MRLLLGAAAFLTSFPSVTFPACEDSFLAIGKGTWSAYTAVDAGNGLVFQEKSVDKNPDEHILQVFDCQRQVYLSIICTSGETEVCSGAFDGPEMDSENVGYLSNLFLESEPLPRTLDDLIDIQASDIDGFYSYSQPEDYPGLTIKTRGLWDSYGTCPCDTFYPELPGNLD
ncbi:hypothetical protein LCGC14_2125390 [marine sediment metagenome]|uniref:Uncharacterized protein n=1 Tax=marine sediment metagenome TaxID=412755 RepID=A0A0F9EQ70_9ZZZZ